MTGKKVKFFPITEKIKIKFTFFLVNTKNISSHVLKISANYWYYQYIRWNIFGIHLKKVNILYILSVNTVNFWYFKHWYLKVFSYIKEYSQNIFPISFCISTPVLSNYWYLEVNFLGPEKYTVDSRYLHLDYFNRLSRRDNLILCFNIEIYHQVTKYCG